MNDIKLTLAERVILANQNRILEKLNPDRAEDYALKAEIAERGLEGLYEDELFEDLSTAISVEVCVETELILTMLGVLESFAGTLTEDEIGSLDLERIRFEGFDANNDPHYRYFKFIVENAGRFEGFRNRQMNSHSIATLGRYRRMREVYDQMIAKGEYQMNIEWLRKIIQAA